MGAHKELSLIPRNRGLPPDHYRSRETITSDMKVLALAVLILAISGLEAGVVKREVPNAEQVSEFFNSWFETLKTNAEEWAKKIQNGEIQAQAGQVLEQTKTQTEPIKAELEKFFATILEAGKKIAS
ncbi:apolipoprotein A-II-like [Bufo bufo]|uniref:apolipoprotein A-II-like n=1 Tax=Bufo bufo TaxID=8384 RepID=UPI001ABDBE56|nr:apolipoprotein A-II-like [Bufo bufo]